MCLFKDTVSGSKTTVVNIRDKVLALGVLNFLDWEMQNRVRDRKIREYPTLEEVTVSSS